MRKQVLVQSWGLLVLMLTVSGLAWGGPAQTTQFIKIDQFGYFPNSKKVAVISNPQAGFNAGQSFSPGTGTNQYQVRRWSDDAVVFSGTIRAWNGGATHAQSGDQGWHFDFSSLKTPGSYYIFDTRNNVGSFRFDIGNNVYDEVLKHAVRSYYYQRLNTPKLATHAGAKWADGTNFEGSNQDRFATSRFSKGNMATAKDLHGGWMDAGDVNKYTTFAESVVIQLAEAYRQNPRVFKDDYDIPESGNGIPDILDELRYELEFLKRMQNATGTGGLFLKVGVDNYNDVSPISQDRRPRYYLPECTSSTLAGAAMFAVAGQSFKQHPSQVNYGNDLISRARSAWNRAKVTTNNFTTFQTTCDDGNIKAGDADREGTAQEQIESAFIAAVYLFEATGQAEFRNFVESRYTSVRPYNGGWWGPYRPHVQMALLRYAGITGVNSTVAANVRNQKAGQNGTMSINNYNAQTDLYRAFMPDAQYGWSSNQVKADCGNINMDFVNFNINSSNHSLYREVAEQHLHYIHGVNPLSLVMLSNMGSAGAERSISEIYHTWFADGTKWDNAKTSSNGPAPGFVTGGPNKKYDGSLPNIANQPAQKAFQETNSKSEQVKSWTLSEPAIYTQAAYVSLLARIMSPNTAPTANAEPSDTQAPSAPTNLSASNIHTSGFTLSWRASTDNVGVLGYDVYRGTTKVNSAPVSGTSLSISGLASNTEYSLTVRARDAAGNVSAASSPLEVRTGATSQTIYADALAADWLNWSWGSSVAFNHTNRKFSGTSAILCNYTAGYGALSLRKGTAVNANNVQSIRFRVFATSTKNLLVNIQTSDNGGGSTQIPITTEANSWKEITLTKAQMGNPSAIKRLNIQANSASAIGEVWFDDVRFISSTSNARMASVEEESTTVENTISLEVFPNPAQDFLHVALFAQQEGDADVQILNAQGMITRFFSQSIIAGRNDFTVPLQNMPAGTYFLVAMYDNRRTSLKFIIL